MGDTPARHLDIQQPRLFGSIWWEHTSPKEEQHTCHDKTCSVPMDKLEDYRRTIAHKLNGKERRHHWNPSHTRPPIPKKNVGYSMERRNIVQGEDQREATKTSDHHTSHEKQARVKHASNRSWATAKPAAAFQKIHRQAAKETRRVKHQATNSSRT